MDSVSSKGDAQLFAVRVDKAQEGSSVYPFLLTLSYIEYLVKVIGIASEAVLAKNSYWSSSVRAMPS